LVTRCELFDLLHQFAVLVAAVVALTFALRWLGGIP
jgi:hypothetical protein